MRKVRRKVNKELIETINRILKMPKEEKLKRADEAIKAYAKWRKKTGAGISK